MAVEAEVRIDRRLERQLELLQVEAALLRVVIARLQVVGLGEVRGREVGDRGDVGLSDCCAVLPVGDARSRGCRRRRSGLVGLKRSVERSSIVGVRLRNR